MAFEDVDADFVKAAIQSIQAKPGELRDEPVLGPAPEVNGFKKLGPCLLLYKVGEGGMGAVFRAFHLKFKFEVCVKCLFPRFDANHNELIERFEREASLQARTSHANLVRVFEINCECGIYYIIMELVEGESAHKLLSRRNEGLPPEQVQGFPVTTALSIALQASRGLAALHREKIVHRDIKPHNILIRRKDGLAKLADLGLAANKAQGSDSSLGRDNGLTIPDTVMGTYRYMPPEQWLGLGNVDAPGDVWAVGVTLYYLLAGKDAYPERTATELMQRICNQDPFPDISKVVPDIPLEVVKVLEECTQKAAGGRLQNAEQLANRLEACLKKLEESGAPADGGTATWSEPVALPPGKRSPGGRRISLGWLVVALAIVVTGSVGLVLKGTRPRTFEMQGFKYTGKNLQGFEELEHTLTGIQMVLIPGAELTMGADDGAADEKPRHRVALDQFLIAKYELSNLEWAKARNVIAPAADESAKPREKLSWDDCLAFCETTGLRLPTEAQWEYACRGAAAELPPLSELGVVAWYAENSDGKVQPRAKRIPNRFGLHDMQGNVSEWCADFYDGGFYGKASGVAVNPECATGTKRVLRGGSYESDGQNCRATSRNKQYPGTALRGQGFRPAFWPLK